MSEWKLWKLLREWNPKAGDVFIDNEGDQLEIKSANSRGFAAKYFWQENFEWETWDEHERYNDLKFTPLVKRHPSELDFSVRVRVPAPLKKVGYPKLETRHVWVTSDGYEFLLESDAVLHEFRKGLVEQFTQMQKQRHFQAENVATWILNNFTLTPKKVPAAIDNHE